MHSLLSDIGLSIVFAAAIGAFFYRFKLPLLLAYLVAGVILGPNLGFKLLTDQTAIENVAEIGLVLLMFILGLEIDVRKILQLGKAVFINGVTQFALCALMAIGFFALLGYKTAFGPYSLVYLAVATSLSSTLIVVKVLSDRMELGTLTSRITLGVLVLQDLWAIAFLAVQPRMDHLSASALAVSFGSAALLLAIGIGLAKFALPKLFALIARQPELMLITAVGWCAFMAGVATALHLSVEMGALFAGVCIASMPYQGDVAAKIAPLRDFFITLFFVGLGLQIPMPTPAVLGLAAAVVAFVLFSRFVSVFPVLHLLRYGNRAAIVTSLNLSQLSEFALVLAALGVTYHHITQDMLSAFILAMTVTALVSALAIPQSHGIFQWLNPVFETLGFSDRLAGQEIVEAHHHPGAPGIVLLGFYREASSLLTEIERRGAERDIMIVDFNPEALKGLRDKGIRCAYGDVSNPGTLAHIGLDDAEILISTVPDQLLKGTSNLDLLKVLKVLAPQAIKIMTAETMGGARAMYEAGADYVILPRIVSASYLSDVLAKIGAGNLAVIREAAAAFIEHRVEVLP